MPPPVGRRRQVQTDYVSGPRGNSWFSRCEKRLWPEDETGGRVRAPKAKPRALGALPQAGRRGKLAETRTAPPPPCPSLPTFRNGWTCGKTTTLNLLPVVGADPLALAPAAPTKPRLPTGEGLGLTLAGAASPWNSRTSSPSFHMRFLTC